jgi:predicted MFS family arabinose efflux permease
MAADPAVGDATSDSTVADLAAATSPAAAVGTRRRPGGLLWQRDFRLLWIGETTSRLGATVSTVAIPLVAVVVLHVDAFLVSALDAAVWVPWLFIALPVGAWVDRLPRRPIMVVSDLASVLLLASVPVAAWCGALTYLQLFAVALLTGTSSVLFTTAYRAYLPSIVAPADLPEGNAKLQGSEAAAQVAGPGLGGVLAQAFGIVTGLFADALSSLVSAVCLLTIRTPEPRPAARARDSTLRAEIGEGVRFLVRDPYLRLFAVFGAASNFALDGLMAILVVFLVRAVGVAPGWLGAILAVVSVGGVVGALVATRLARRFGSARAVLLSELGAAPFALLIPLTAHGAAVAYVVGGGFVLMAGIVVSNVVVGSFRQLYCPPELFGRVSASAQVLNYGAIPLGALCAGALADGIGIRPAVWVMCALVVLAATILLTGPLRHRRDLPSAPETGVARQCR